VVIWLFGDRVFRLMYRVVAQKSKPLPIFQKNRIKDFQRY